MCSLDDELALFESEISSLVETSDNGQPNGASTSGYSAHSSAMAPSGSAPVAYPPTNAIPLTMPVVSPFIASALTRPLLGGVLVPPIPQALFIPPQMRPPLASQLGATIVAAPLINRPAATIESAPSLYEKPISSIPAAPLQTMALPADIEAMAFKRQTDPLKKRLKEKVKKKFIRSGGGQVWEDSSLAEWDENDFRIFCGDLGNEVSDELLAKAFRKYPSFQKAKVVRDSRSNKSKGYGFVSFRESDDYVRAMREMDGKYVGNRPIKLRKSNWKERNLDTIKKKQKQKKDLGLWG